MEKDILVSIVMPAFNAEETIGRAIDSVLGQTYPHWELLVVDDGSSDATLPVAQKYSSADPRIAVLVNPENRGVSEARNRAVAGAAGEWVAFLDSDDMWAADKLKRQIARIRRETALGKTPDIVFTGSAFIDRSGVPSSYRLNVPEEISYRELLKQNVISCSSVLVRRELALKYPMRRDDMHEDYAVWLQILKNGGRACGINEPLLIYRVSGGSRSGSKARAARMTYRVYRFMGLDRLRSFCYLCRYTCRNLKKYRRIYGGFR